MDPLPVLEYHRRTKHRFERFARGPDTLDWDDQPAPFRHFEGAPRIALPGLPEALENPALAEALQQPLSRLPKAEPLPVDAIALSVLLQLALGITAWKSYGPDRWALRANPSSGNLHPVEAYLVMRGITGFADGIYHYCPDDHALECRAEFAPSTGAPQLLAGISSVMWREAWKYGERAFRYCQLDTGHAVGAFCYAAALLGWPCIEQPQVSTEGLTHLLGLDRTQEFSAGRVSFTEREEAEMLLALMPGNADFDWLEIAVKNAQWHGTASAIDRHPMYRWDVIDEAASATRHASMAESAVRPSTRQTLPDSGFPAARLILQRRSAQRFDPRYIMPLQDFYALLQELLPTASIPWNTFVSPPRIGLVLFVHRVASLEPGLYLLPRATALAEHVRQDFQLSAVAGAPETLNLQRLTPAPPGELQRAARSIHCHQDIASSACFVLGMLAEFDTVISADPAAYRDLHREAGLIGQVLYLHAEACELRGTGVGCYFDDPFHELLGLQDERYQSVYHFTVGLPLEDTRIVTTITDQMRLPS